MVFTEKYIPPPLYTSNTWHTPKIQNHAAMRGVVRPEEFPTAAKLEGVPGFQETVHWYVVGVELESLEESETQWVYSARHVEAGSWVGSPLTPLDIG